LTTLSAFRLGDRAGEAWRRLLEVSPNATLFHDEQFLAYHPSSRFDRVHLLIGKEPVHPQAALPAAFLTSADGTRELRSPYGGSFGGPALAPGLGLEEQLAVVDAIVGFAIREGCRRVALGVVPTLAWRTPDERWEFALRHRGFVDESTHLLNAVPLDAPLPTLIGRMHRKKRKAFRLALASGFTVGGEDDIAGFYSLLEANRAGVQPTHSLAEVRWLLSHLPDRIRLVSVRQAGRLVAAGLLMQVTPRLLYTFYLCDDPAHGAEHAVERVVFHAMDLAVESGCAWLDFGPSTHSLFELHGSLHRFKEQFGAHGFIRRTLARDVA
jgi:hypothetical protein